MTNAFTSEDVRLVASSGYFDAEYYLRYAPDVAQAGVDPLAHFMRHGWHEGRNPSARFDMQYYVEAHVDEFRASGGFVNPLLHFLRIGVKKGYMAYPTVFPRGKAIADVVTYARRPAIATLSDSPSEIAGSVAVVIHLFYIDRIDEFVSYLANIPVKFDLFVTVVDADTDAIRSRFVQSVANCAACHVVRCENAGRDIGPFCVEFANRLVHYDYVCKVHTKRDKVGLGWSTLTLNNLLGSPAVVRTVFSAFSSDPRLGLVYPTPPASVLKAISRKGSWGLNEGVARRLCDSLGIGQVDGDAHFDFPAGSMFWARTAALYPLLSRSYAYSEFDGLTLSDGSLAHAVERLFGVVPSLLGYGVKDIRLLPPHPLEVPRPYDPVPDAELVSRIEAYKASRGSRNRIAVFTAAVGGYDKLMIPEELDGGVDYYCFSDRMLEGPSPWHFLPLDYHSVDVTRIARFYKLHPFLHFSTYDYVIWIDANILLRRNVVAKLVDAYKAGSSPVAFPLHTQRVCTYEEAEACKQFGKDDPELIDSQIARYRKSGFPEGFGLPETNVYVTSPKTELAWRVFAEWWKEVEDGSRRDQLSIMYVLWRLKAGFTPLFRDYELGPRFNERDFLFLYHNGKSNLLHPSVYHYPGFVREVDASRACSDEYVRLYGRNASSATRSVTVVVAVHDALPDVKNCLESLDASLDESVRVVIVDDGSDKECADFLGSYAGSRGNVFVVRHQAAMGYTASINDAVRFYPDSDYYVFLNSDTVVPRNWIGKLLRAAESSPSIGVVGPLSNAATWQTVPVLKKDGVHVINSLPDGVGVEDMDSLCESLAPPGVYPKTQLVNGFCYMVKRSVFDRIGLFDEENFSPGYAEEDDFSLRAVDAGFILAIAPDTYVFHAKSKSFGRANRDKLAAEHLERLYAKHMRHRIRRECASLGANTVLSWMRDGILCALNSTLPYTRCMDCAILSPVDATAGNSNEKIERSLKMAVSSDWIKKIMGSPNSVTASLVSMRKKPAGKELETGVWYSDFTRVKSEAERRGLPFFAMWTNGDVCGLCRRFTANVIAPEFIAYMKKSGGLWWLGGSMDDSDDDKRGGVGFKWCTAPDGHVNYFPFFAVSHVQNGKRVEFFGSGNDYDNGRQAPTGTSLTISKLKKLVQEPSGKKAAAVKPGCGGATNAATVSCGGGDAKKEQVAACPAKSGKLLHIRFNPEWDAAHIARFQAALRDNGGHCVCQPRSPDTMCTCRAFLEQGVPGLCRCGAFEKYEA